MTDAPHSAPEVFYMTLGDLGLEIELVRRADYDGLFEQLRLVEAERDEWKRVAEELAREPQDEDA